MTSRPIFFLSFLSANFGSLAVPDPLNLVEIGASIQNWWVPRLKWRLDPLLGPFLAILSHFGPFWAFFLTLFGHLGEGQMLQVGPTP